MTKQKQPDLTEREKTIVLAYRDRTRTVPEALRACGATNAQLYAALSKAREPFRRPGLATPGRRPKRIGLSRAELLGIVTPGAERPHDEPLERRLTRLLSARIADLEDHVAHGRGADPEATARALAVNARTLATLRRTESGIHDAPIAPADAAPARSLSDLRDELYGHLLRIHDESQARRGFGPAEPDAA